jgi:hypothetical protein
MSEIRTNEWWRMLSNYESSDLVKVRFKAMHGRELNTSKASEICASITQARGYMESANGAGRSVRPLLLYYGILGLARGLTLFLSTSLREAGLAQAHGLSVSGWGEALKREGGSIGDLKIKLNGNGTLQQLIDETDHRAFLRVNSSKPNFVIDYAIPPPDTEVRLAEILSRIPEIRPSYSRWLPDSREIVAFWPQNHRPDGKRCCRVDLPYTAEDIRAVMGDAVLELNTEGSVISILVPGDYRPYMSDTGGRWAVGNVVAMMPFPGGVQLSKIVITFMAAYGLGMLARYYPSQWTAILGNQRHTVALPTLLATMDYIADEFPRMIVEFLEPPMTA